MTFVPSARQQAIFDRVDRWVETGQRASILVNAVAGSGKTTTILKAMAKIPPSWKKLFLAFNVSAAAEAKERAAEMGIENLDVMTLNSAGYRVLRENKKTFINDKKYAEVLAQLDGFDEKEKKAEHYERAPVLAMISLARAHGIVVKSDSGLTPDSNNVWREIAKKFNIYEFGSRELFMARRALAFGSKSNVADFDDQCYLPFARGYRSKTEYAAVVVDEAQDLTPVQQKLAGMFAAENSLMMFVGDRNQAIYGFRGADVMSMDKILQMYGCEELPLDVSYRCPKAIVAEAQKYSPAIQPHEDAIDGEIQTLDAYYDAHFEPNDLVVCRNSAPLIKLAFKLIGDHKPISISGDIVGRVIGAFRAIKKDAAKRKISPEAAINDDKSVIAGDMDMIDCCESILEMCHGIDDAIGRLNGMLNQVKTGNATRFMTIHKAKGLESDIVWFLEPSLLPSGWARTPEAMLQENNLAYVAVTRAKKLINMITVEGYRGNRDREA